MGMVLAAGAAAADDPLAAHRWKDRVVVIAAPSAGDPHLLEQRTTLAAVPDGVREREIVVVEAVGDGRAAQRLRARLGLENAAFRVVLVGKDGTVKRSDDRPISAETLFGTIDVMPMRRDEMRR
jgi:hypothetical protein